MSERSIRVNELILRELSHILRTRFRDQTVAITLTEVSISPDLRSGRVYYSVIGDERAKIKARSFFTKEYRSLRQLVAQKVILKYFPKFNFIEDDSMARGNRVLDLLGELDGMNAHAADNLHDEDVEDGEWAGEDGEGAWDEGDDAEASDEDDTADDGDAAEDADTKGGAKRSAAGAGKKSSAAKYVFDEDDLEYARDIAADETAMDALDDDDLDDDDVEEFDEESDVEYDGDLDDEEGFGKNSGR